MIEEKNVIWPSWNKSCINVGLITDGNFSLVHKDLKLENQTSAILQINSMCGSVGAKNFIVIRDNYFVRIYNQDDYKMVSDFSF